MTAARPTRCAEPKIEVMRIVDNEITGRSHGLVADITRELARRGAL